MGVYLQVDDANKDHACWERPEDMDTPRIVFKIDRNTPGSDLAAETTAAALAGCFNCLQKKRSHLFQASHQESY